VCQPCGRFLDMGDEYALTKVDGEPMSAQGGNVTIKYPNGDTFEGFFKNGQRDGKGVYTYTNTAEGEEGVADKYDGYWLDGLRDSGWEQEPDAEIVALAGKIRKKTDATPEYTDAVAKNKLGRPKKENLCRHTFSKGGFYHGYMWKNSRHGEGTLKYANGDVYSGNWVAGKKHGMGTYVFNTTKYKFIGNWIGGKMAEGRWVMTNGAYFKGDFSDNKPAGEGVWIMANGDMVDGDYSRRVLPVKKEEKLTTEIELSWQTAGITPAD